MAMNPELSLPTVANLDFVETLYAEYLKAPSSVPEDWRDYFASLSNGDAPHRDFKLTPSFRPQSIFHSSGAASPGSEEEMMLLQHRTDRMIRAYRERGHIQSRIDPLSERVR